MALHASSWSDAIRAGQTAQRWAKQAMMETYGSHPSLQLILLRQALSTDPETRRWLTENDQNRWTPETLIRDFIAKFGSASEAEAPQHPETYAPWISLPPEILFRILRYLSPSELRSCTLVCQVFRTASNDDALWRALHIRAWGDLPAPQGSWRKQFARSCFPSETKQSSMRVRLDRQIVWSGQTTPLTGEVYVRLRKPIKTTGLTVTLFGAEKAQVTGMVQNKQQTRNNFTTVEIAHQYFCVEKHLMGAPQEEGDYIEERKPITLQPGLYTVPFAFSVPAHGLHGRTLQRTFMHPDPLVIVQYGVTAKIEVATQANSTLESMLSVFSPSEYSATATFFVDRLYETALLRSPEPVEQSAEMTFMFGGPVRAKLAATSRAAVVGNPCNLSLQIDNRSNYDVIGATLSLDSFCRQRPYSGALPSGAHIETRGSRSSDKGVHNLPCPFVQAPSGVSTAWNIPFAIPSNAGPSIPHGHLFEFGHTISIHISISLTLSPLVVRIPVVLLGANFSN